jgi:hypothetical protein
LVQIPERDRREKVRFDRKHLEARARRFLKAYLAADETRKPNFYRAVEDASQKCHPAETDYELEDAQIAEATADAAMKVVSDRTDKDADHEGGRISAFITDSYATVAVAYHRAAGIYVEDGEMLELGTAAVHLLTIATSYVMGQKE